MQHCCVTRKTSGQAASDRRQHGSKARVGWIKWGTRDLGLHSSETVPLSLRVLVMFGNVSPGSRKYCALSKAGDRFSPRKHSLALCNASLIRYLGPLSERNASRNLVALVVRFFASFFYEFLSIFGKNTLSKYLIPIWYRHGFESAIVIPELELFFDRKAL